MSIIDGNTDERKSAKIAAQHVKAEPGRKIIHDFAFAREILRSSAIKQNGPGAEHFEGVDPEHMPVFYLDGEIHRQRRAAIVKFFTPKAIQTRYRAVMEKTTDDLLARLQARGEGRLDQISFELAVAVAAEIVGLTESDPAEMAPRVAVLLSSSFDEAKGPVGLFNKIKRAWYGYRFYTKDVRPAVRARREARREDVISQTLDKGYSDRAIIIECMTYATAGMVTTREFIVMVAWYMFDRPELKTQFLEADESGQMAILQEILRLEPIAARVYRRAETDIPETCQGPVAAGTLYAVDIRSANSDESVVGKCPHMFDAERAAKQKQPGAFMSFGDGPHYCPGSQVALHETRIFVDRLLRVPGIHLKRAPDMLWNMPLLSYELRNAVVACDRTGG